MRCARWMLAALLAVAMLAVPSLAVGQDDPDPSDVPAQVVPEDPTADDPAPADPSVEPPAVLQDPAQVGTAPADVAPAPDAPTVAPLQAPPVNELSRFSDERRAPLWQQRDGWRSRGLFYRWRDGWFLQRGPSWWRWVGRWTPCPRPGDWRPDVVRPVPVSDPAPGHPTFDAVREAVAPIVAPTTVPRPTQQNRAQVIRRALRVCQARYVRGVLVLRALRRQGRISFLEYRRGVRVALVRRAVCRRAVFRMVSVRG